MLVYIPAAFAEGIRIDVPERVDTGGAFVVRVRTQGLEGLKVEWLGRSVAPMVENGAAEVLLGVGLDVDPGEYEIKVAADTPEGGEAVTRTVAVAAKSYPEQHLEVEREMVHLTQEQLDRHYREKERVRAVLDSTLPERYWSCPFERPVGGDQTSAYGLRRFFNGEARRPHSGVDLRAAEGAPVRAFAAGRVVLAEEHYFSGNVVYIDHGQGLVSMYCHLSKIEAQVGRFVSKGEVIGLAGSTGRVTGPHLHFGVGILGQMVDPLALFGAICPEPSEGG